MVDMLINRCPNLEDLEVLQQMAGRSFGVVWARILFDKGRWPKLRRLTTGSQCLIDENADEFFKAHPLLRQITIRGSNFQLPFRHLPSLRHLSLDYIPEPREVVDVAGCLEGFSVFLADYDGEENSRIDELFPLFRNLRHLLLRNAFYNEKFILGIAQLAPTLERLAFSWNNHSNYVDEIKVRDAVAYRCSYFYKLHHRIATFSSDSLLNFLDSRI